MNLLEWGFLLVFPITQEYFVSLKERVAFCTVYRDGKLADYTEGKVLIKATSIYVSSMYRNLQGLGLWQWNVRLVRTCSKERAHWLHKDERTHQFGMQQL
jgi:hypothetical protein